MPLNAIDNLEHVYAESGAFHGSAPRVQTRETARTKDQLGLDQIGLLRIGDRHHTAIRCSDVVTVGHFGLKCPY